VPTSQGQQTTAPAVANGQMTCLPEPKRTHESTAGHSGNMRPSVQRAVIPNIIQQSICNSGSSFFSWYGQTQGLLVRLSNLITKRCD